MTRAGLLATLILPVMAAKAHADITPRSYLCVVEHDAGLVENDTHSFMGPMRMSTGRDRLTVRVAQYIHSDDELTLCRVAVK